MAPKVQLTEPTLDLVWDGYYSGFRLVGQTHVTRPYISVEATWRAIDRGEVYPISVIPAHSRERWEHQGTLPRGTHGDEVGHESAQVEANH